MNLNMKILLILTLVTYHFIDCRVIYAPVDNGEADHFNGFYSFYKWLRYPRQNDAGANYCAIDENHTMCRFQDASDDCAASMSHAGLSVDTRQALVRLHNEVRSRVALGQIDGQPPAANMRKLTWSTELESIAQRWAEQCRFGHDDIRNKLDNTYVGQNLWSYSSSDEKSAMDIQKIAEGAVDSWFSEVNDPGFDPTNIEPYGFDMGTGHYTQTVWADTSEVGCGLVYYKEGEWYTVILVCNYAIGGNFAGDSMYIQGEACSECPAGTQCDGDGLCA